MTAEEFNKLYSVGTTVDYHPIIGEPECVRTRTRSDAWTLHSGHHVVKVEGKAGCVHIEALTIPPEVQRYAELGSRVESHHLTCFCDDCRAFMDQAEIVHSNGMHA